MAQLGTRLSAGAGSGHETDRLALVCGMSPADDPRHGGLEGVVVQTLFSDSPDDVPDQEGFQNEYARNDTQVSQVEDRPDVVDIAFMGDHLDEISNVAPKDPVNQV